MGKKHEQDLRLVEGVVAAQLAERDAEIAALRAQVEELEAWKAAVPVKELNRLMTVSPFDSVEADIVWKWLKFSRQRHNR